MPSVIEARYSEVSSAADQCGSVLAAQGFAIYNKGASAEGRASFPLPLPTSGGSTFGPGTMPTFWGGRYGRKGAEAVPLGYWACKFSVCGLWLMRVASLGFV